MSKKKNNYRLEKTAGLNDLHSIFDADNGQFGKGITLQYRILSAITADGNWLSTYYLGRDLYCNSRCADGTIDKIIISPEGNFFVSKVPTLNLYQLPKNQFHKSNGVTK